MIISHRHKFIFMHSRKCAGSTIEVMLNKSLGPHDIQIGAWPETIKAGGKVNRRALFDAASSPIFWRAACANLPAYVRKKEAAEFPKVLNAAIKQKYKRQLAGIPSHPTAAAVSTSFPREWSEYFTFAFVRNPFEFEVSDYFWRSRGLSLAVSFKEFLRRKLDSYRHDPENLIPSPVTNWPIYTINNAMAVDYVGRFEDLSNELKRIGDTIGVSFDIEATPRAKSQYRKNRDSAELYDEESIAMVYQLHENEIRFFGYRYPS